jgi:hypothetical protein
LADNLSDPGFSVLAGAFDGAAIERKAAPP